LLKIINGLYKADTGAVFLDGKQLTLHGPVDALKAGISMIYQELNIIPEMTVLENMYLGRELLGPSGMMDHARMARQARAFLDAQGLQTYDLRRRMKHLSVAEAQMMEIVKAISVHAKVILMDEPTSSLTEKEVDYLFAKIDELKQQNISILFISHKMDEIFKVADSITVLRDGAHIGTMEAGQTDIQHIIEMMVGRKMNEVYPKKTSGIGEEVMRVTGFTRRGVFEDVSFSLRRGEILGFSGLVGAGRTEIARAVMAMDPHDSGEISLAGKPVRFKSVRRHIGGIMLRAGGPAAAGAGADAQRGGEHRAGGAQARVSQQVAQKEGAARAGRADDRPPDHQNAVCKHACRVAVGRQPTKGGAGQVVVYRADGAVDG